MPDKGQNFSHVYVLYDPPARGLPWLSVCIGPDRRIFTAETFETQAAALQRMAARVDLFVEEAQPHRAPRVWHVTLTGAPR
ncbi:hypothetical protein U8607_11300 [Methylobacterium durans]|uniref:Uncharacterized protein n=1 Tax=Methylobacterium durans TaxID=2202825 RepID=A0A2U8WEF5_9HYPH|nr:hypothetical protein [Methylobacterium durans]AWN43662.1 hypothetical protein DK389_28070 [Methylobacterium durans]MEA1832667.1 hypothetical protein [Methylobacterium durans]